MFSLQFLCIFTNDILYLRLMPQDFYISTLTRNRFIIRFFATIRTTRTKRANYIIVVSHIIIVIFPYFWCRFKRNDTESASTRSGVFYCYSVLQISQIFLYFLSVFPLFYTNRQLMLFFTLCFFFCVTFCFTWNNFCASL